MSPPVPALSIVVPVYKVEAYVEKCIASILANELFDSRCELIVVDDGSPDESMAIVERLCEHRPNVTLVRQANQGLGAARNAGEGRARGDYLWFVDSDDWLPEDAIERILALIAATAPDVVNIDYVMSDGRRTPVKNRAMPGVVYCGLDYLQQSYVQNPVQYYVFRTRFYRDRGLHFEKGIYHEDALFTPTALFEAARVVRLAHDCYVYNLREASIMTSGNHLKHARDMLTVVARLEAFRARRAGGWRPSRVLARYAAVAVGGVYYYWKRLGPAERRMVSGEMSGRLLLAPILSSGALKYLAAAAVMLGWRTLGRSQPLPRG
jgi:glycosyltransferase involved in cell wall biosynthesis